MIAPAPVKLALTTVALCAALLAGCGDDDDNETSKSALEAGPRLTEQWAGTVAGTDSYISVFTLDDGQTGAYLADGNRIAVLALGSLEGGRLSLESEDGASVTGRARGGTAKGAVALGGKRYRFSATAATGTAGWYRARRTVEGKPVAAGYIVLSDGSQRGAVRHGERVIAAPKLDVSNPTIRADGVGALTLAPVAEFVVREGGLS